MRSSKTTLITCVWLLVLGLVSGSRIAGAKDEKLKPEELVARHLDSIGSAEKRSAVQSRATSGAAQVVFRVGGSGTLNGKGAIVSQSKAVRADFTFPVLEYSGERIAFDGSKVTVGQISPGNYPPLSRFLYENNYLLKEGLLFGTLSTSWALLDVAGKKPKLESNGLKKISGRQLYELKYTSRSPGSMQASLYFDPETFRHVQSQFKMEVPAPAATKITDSAEMVRYQIIEQFDQFKEVDGLTLPHSYTIDFTIDAPRGGLLSSWTHAIESIKHNDTIESRLFSVQ